MKRLEESSESVSNDSQVLKVLDREPNKDRIFFQCIKVCKQEKVMNKVTLCVTRNAFTFSVLCSVLKSMLPHSGSGVSAGLEGVAFCLYMKVNKKRAMSCEHQQLVCEVTADQQRLSTRPSLSSKSMRRSSSTARQKKQMSRNRKYQDKCIIIHD